MFRFKREDILSSSSASLSHSDSESSVSEIIDLVDTLEINIHHVQETILPSLQQDLQKLKKKLRKQKYRNRKINAKDTPTLKNDFQHISTESKFGYRKGDRVTIKNSLVINGYTVPNKYKTGTIEDFTNRFVVITITYKRDKQVYSKSVYCESKNIRLA